MEDKTPPKTVLGLFESAKQKDEEILQYKLLDIKAWKDLRIIQRELWAVGISSMIVFISLVTLSVHYLSITLSIIAAISGYCSSAAFLALRKIRQPLKALQDNFL